MLFSEALLNATYRDGRPGQMTKEHKRAEYHPFKTQHLFKEKRIPLQPYVTRLIQHLLIIKALENRLQTLSEINKSEISAFFALSYLEQLWRTASIEQDLAQLGVNNERIPPSEIAKATSQYLTQINTLAPKALLAHFLFHIAGFMHGGGIVTSKYIVPSNRLTSYQIGTSQYDFSTAAASLPESHRATLLLYRDMMNQIDTIPLSDSEYQDIIEEGKTIYQTMANIYDELCAMYTPRRANLGYLIAIMSVGMVAMAYLFNRVDSEESRSINSTSALR